jgi:hypothetical protein
LKETSGREKTDIFPLSRTYSSEAEKSTESGAVPAGNTPILVSAADNRRENRKARHPQAHPAIDFGKILEFDIGLSFSE